MNTYLRKSIENDYESDSLIDLICKILVSNKLFLTYEQAIEFVINFSKDEQAGLFAIISQNFEIIDFSNFIKELIRSRFNYNLWLKLLKLKHSNIISRVLE